MEASVALWQISEHICAHEHKESLYSSYIPEKVKAGRLSAISPRTKDGPQKKVSKNRKDCNIFRGCISILYVDIPKLGAS